MATPRRRLAILTFTLTLLGTLSLPGAVPSSNAPDNWERLRTMPPELRNHLADQLKAFNLLDRDEQEAVRTLDRKVASEPDEDRATDYAVLRRYHLWLQTLTEAQRAELSATPPSKRFALVTKILAERKGNDPTESSFYHYVDFNGVSPFELAQRIEVWLKLSDVQKAKVAKLLEPDRHRRMGQYVREMKIPHQRPTPSEIEALYDRALESGRFPYLKKTEEARKQAKQNSKEAEKQTRIKHRFVDNYYFVEHPPAKVNPDKLLQFDRALPFWIRGGLDPLSPDEARRRLTVLYRLVYPHGEMPDVVKSAAPATSDRPASPGPSRPPATPKRAGNPSPF